MQLLCHASGNIIHKNKKTDHFVIVIGYSLIMKSPVQYIVQVTEQAAHYLRI